ncbi:hypothetical protein CMT52_16915 [Elizabethkingia anophelis]|nr:hypothetical protein [Elizabethkingia anophelis]MDV4026015.1 hypothetical protein [Elizabethkingia anophelis]
MKKITFLFFLSLVYWVSAQKYIKVNISDKSSNLTIPNARIVYENQVFYSNDDGDVNIPDNIGAFEVSAPSYKTIKLSSLSGSIKLEPQYNEIQEVVLNKLDVKKIFQNTLKNYLALYYTKPSLYDGTIKQKGYIDGKIINLFVADINLWSLYNFFNFKAANDVDSFVQVQLDAIKYYKTEKNNTNYPFNTDLHIIPKDFVQKLFMNSQLLGVLNDTKNTEIIGRVNDKNADLEYITYESKKNNKDSEKIRGSIAYSVKDSLITNLTVSVDQANNIQIQKNKKGEEYSIKTTEFYIMFDFYKNSGQYIPSQVKTIIKAVVSYKGNSFPASLVQEINFTNFKSANKKGLNNKIDLGKNLTDNVPSKEMNKTNSILLSKEELKFINEP